MRKLVVTENITLDGVIEATGGWFTPAGDEADVDNSDMEAAVRRQTEADDAVLFGRATFEEFQGYWPAQTDDTTGITAHLNEVTKYVVSGTLREPQWENTEVLRGGLVDEVQALKEQPGREIVVTRQHHTRARVDRRWARRRVPAVSLPRGRRARSATLRECGGYTSTKAGRS